MQFIIARSDFVKLIGCVLNVVSNKPAIPILNNVLIEAYADQLILSATDLTVSVRTYTDAKVTQEGAITLPARHIAQLVRELTAPQIEITCADDIATIVAGSSRFKINGMGKADFPNLPDFADAPTFIMAGEQLKTLFSKTAFAAAKDDSRQVLNGILMQMTQGRVSYIATDGKRLARVHAPLETTVVAEGQYILPLKAVEEVTKSLDPEQLAKVYLAQDRMAIESGSTTFMTKLLSGDYPDIERVIPVSSAVTVRLHKDELISLLRQASLFTNERSHSVRFAFAPGELRLLAASSNIGEGVVSMPVDYAGEPLEIAFNPTYFLDMLRHTNDETVAFGITDPYNPGMVTDSTAAQFVIMPMRIEQPAHA